MGMVSNYACHYGKVKSVSLSFIWVVILQAIRGIFLGDGGLVIGIWGWALLGSNTW